MPKKDMNGDQMMDDFEEESGLDSSKPMSLISPATKSFCSKKAMKTKHASIGPL